MTFKLNSIPLKMPSRSWTRREKPDKRMIDSNNKSKKDKIKLLKTLLILFSLDSDKNISKLSSTMKKVMIKQELMLNMNSITWKSKENTSMKEQMLMNHNKKNSQERQPEFLKKCWRLKEVTEKKRTDGEVRNFYTHDNGCKMLKMKSLESQKRRNTTISCLLLFQKNLKTSKNNSKGPTHKTTSEALNLPRERHKGTSTKLRKRWTELFLLEKELMPNMQSSLKTQPSTLKRLRHKLLWMRLNTTRPPSMPRSMLLEIFSTKLMMKPPKKRSESKLEASMKISLKLRAPLLNRWMLSTWLPTESWPTMTWELPLQPKPKRMKLSDGPSKISKKWRTRSREYKTSFDPLKVSEKSQTRTFQLVSQPISTTWMTQVSHSSPVKPNGTTNLTITNHTTVPTVLNTVLMVTTVTTVLKLLEQLLVMTQLCSIPLLVYLPQLTLAHLLKDSDLLLEDSELQLEDLDLLLEKKMKMEQQRCHQVLTNRNSQVKRRNQQILVSMILPKIHLLMDLSQVKKEILIHSSYQIMMDLFKNNLHGKCNKKLKKLWEKKQRLSMTSCSKSCKMIQKAFAHFQIACCNMP